MKPRVEIYDTTLRDGAQGEGVSFSGVGKILVAKRLDEFGVDYIEGGYAASNPKDMEFFRAIKSEKFTNARIAAFGSTRRANVPVAEDQGCRALIEADTPVCTIFGKSWRLHVREVLRTTEEENRAMIADTVRFLKERGKEVIYDAEHFFDGYADSREHALATLRAAVEAGADRLVLCDTNGGSLPDTVAAVVRDVCAVFPNARIGIHTHNDSELGVANSIAAVRAGALHVQGTINGFGERVGNANLVSIIPILLLKMGYDCMQPHSLRQLKAVSQYVYEMASVRPNPKQPFVGDSAFAHKAGMHVDGVRKIASSFEHIDPALVGNQRRILISELSGASNVFLKAVEMGLQLEKNSPEIRQILRELENLEKEGYAFEAAEASFKLLIQKVLKRHKPFFQQLGYRVIVEKRRHDEASLAEATVKLAVNGEIESTVGEGDGPVDALNDALRKALTRFYPSIREVQLVDYQVRILDPETGTAAKTRVLIESSDGKQSWGTVGVSTNLIEASWEALVDSVEYKLFLEEQAANSGR
ncbi:MAG: citramalate synthase [Kiritimatiellae bacterium]|nr:citramalate synthase [Kiritimatiellia bacterium]MDW8459255.1 citramalate synthase [Verrucomicrobiota bacterium]